MWFQKNYSKQYVDKINSGQAEDTPVEKCVISKTKQGDY